MQTSQQRFFQLLLVIVILLLTGGVVLKVMGFEIMGGPWKTTLPPANPKTCGNFRKNVNEECDDGNKVDGDGCSNLCRVENGWRCDWQSAEEAQGGDTTNEYSKCVNLVQENCGNGKIDPGETCDDGNNISDDGCSDQCQVEQGWECVPNHAPSTCRAICGNGKLDAGEECDPLLHNSEAKAGCGTDCKVLPGWTCSLEPFPHCDRKAGQAASGQGTSLFLPCGDGRREAKEKCDLGADNGKGMGCTTKCTVEGGWACTGNPTVCVPRKKKQLK